MEHEEKKNYSEIIKRLKRGELDGFFDTLYEDSKSAIFYNIYSFLHDYQLSEDILQETYVRFLENIGKVKEKENPLSYLIVISKNLSLDLIRKKEKERALSEYEEAVLPSTDDIKKEVNSSALLNRICSLLSNERFEIFYLKAMEDYTQKDIAKILHKPMGTIGYEYAEALKTLRKELGYEYQ